MRIGQRGSGFDLPSQGRGSRKADTFRRRHRVGDIVRGTVLRSCGHGLALIAIEDQELVARMGVVPEAGSILDFLVERLSPSIVLRPAEERGRLRTIV